MEKNPWKKLTSKEIYKNPWIRVREDRVITPGGTEGIYGVVETKTAIGIVALTNSEEIYFVGQYRYPIDEYSWEIVEGGSEPGEEPLETAKRELLEEAGVVATHWQQLGSHFHLSNCFTDEVAIIFLATGLTRRQAQPDDTEQLRVKKISVNEAVSLAESGKIKDSITLIALERLSRWLKQKKS